MNKHWIIVGVLVLIILGGIGYSTFLVSEEDRPVSTGIIREVTVTARKDTWTFDPETIEANQGDTIILTVINEDDYDHGFAIDAFGVTQRLPANGTIVIEFVATQPGDFPYYCSVPCGAGEVDGVSRGHFDQIGRLQVRSLIDQDISQAHEDTTEQVLESTEQDKSITTTITSTLRIADEKARELGYTPERLNQTFDTNNNAWHAYHQRIGSPYAQQADFAFLDSDDFYTVMYSPTKSLTNALWVFIHKEKGEVLGYVEGI